MTTRRRILLRISLHVLHVGITIVCFFEIHGVVEKNGGRLGDQRYIIFIRSWDTTVDRGTLMRSEDPDYYVHYPSLWCGGIH